jgi:mRNA interferase YafQ
MLKPRLTSKFKHDLERIKKRGRYDISKLDKVVELLLNETPLPANYADHPLSGTRHGYRSCHIQGDWVLIYKIDKELLILVIAETGTHADIYGR